MERPCLLGIALWTSPSHGVLVGVWHRSRYSDLIEQDADIHIRDDEAGIRCRSQHKMGRRATVDQN